MLLRGRPALKSQLGLLSAGDRECGGCIWTAQRVARRSLTVTVWVGCTGQCRDDALTGSLFASLKGELIETGPGPAELAPAGRLLTGSADTTASGCTALSIQSRRIRNNRHSKIKKIACHGHQLCPSMREEPQMEPRRGKSAVCRCLEADRAGNGLDEGGIR